MASVHRDNSPPSNFVESSKAKVCYSSRLKLVVELELLCLSTEHFHILTPTLYAQGHVCTYTGTHTGMHTHLIPLHRVEGDWRAIVYWCIPLQ